MEVQTAPATLTLPHSSTLWWETFRDPRHGTQPRCMRSDGFGVGLHGAVRCGAMRCVASISRLFPMKLGAALRDAQLCGYGTVLYLKVRYAWPLLRVGTSSPCVLSGSHFDCGPDLTP